MRLVSLCPSITESLVALGAGRDLVGVTRYCVHPKEELARVPRVGGTKNPDLAAIRALEPDLVFMNAEENRAEDVAALQAEFDVFLSHPKRVTEIPGLLRHFGDLVSRREKANEIARRLEEAVSSLRAERDGSTFRYVYLIWKSPWMIAGEGTYIADLVSRAGGVPALSHDAERTTHNVPYPEVTEAEVVASNPDVVLLPDEPYRFTEKDRAFFSERLPDADIRLVSGDDFCWHGVRTLRGIEAARELHRHRAALPALR